MQFSLIFKELCRDKGVTQKKALDDMGMNRNAVQRWKEGDPSADALKKIAEYFNVSVDSLLNPSGNVVFGANNSSIIQGSSGKINVSNYWGSDTSVDNVPLSDQEIELVRIFRKLDLRAKTAAMSFFFDLEDKAKG